jgi:hypothetical protein
MIRLIRPIRPITKPMEGRHLSILSSFRDTRATKFASDRFELNRVAR